MWRLLYVGCSHLTIQNWTLVRSGVGGLRLSKALMFLSSWAVETMTVCTECVSECRVTLGGHQVCLYMILLNPITIKLNLPVINFRLVQ